MPGSNEWGQYYQHALMDNGQRTPPNSGGLSDSTIVTTSSATVTEISTSSPGGQLTPTGSVSKPIRRRSRVSKKTPITLLNANANNFRALVQQFTGCTASSTSLSFGNQKGPINLSFGSNNNMTGSVMTPFVNHNYNYQYQQQLQRLAQQPLQLHQEQQQQLHRQPLLQLQKNQQLHQEHQGMYPIDNVSGSGNDVFQYSSSSGNYNSVPSMEVVDGFVMDQEDIAVYELSREFFSG